MALKEQLVQDLFQAYYNARKNKRNKKDAIKFELNYEKNLFKLADEILDGSYQPGKSTCFIVNKPVKREIFAAAFRDRIVHHYIYNHINPFFEKRFINDSYSCRLGKGTLYGIKRLDHFIRSCSENYKKDCYVLKLDIKGYFMSINRSILYNKVMKTLEHKYEREAVSFLKYSISPMAGVRLPMAGEKNKPAMGRRASAMGGVELADLTRKIVFHDPTVNCIVKGRQEDWAGLPKSKSLFFARSGCGLPIGNLTSQLFGNVYLNEFDYFIKGGLGIRHYGRYVDDFFLIHSDKEYLKLVIPEIRNYLRRELDLELHEKKIYLQHFSKGVRFLGAVIKPYRIYIDKRAKANFYAKIQEWNRLLKTQNNKLLPEQTKEIIACANSYLGLLKHYRSANLKRKIFASFPLYWWNFAYIENCVIKKR